MNAVHSENNEAYIEYTKRNMETGFVICKIPDYMTGGVRNYIFKGIPMGGFLTAVFENNFQDVCAGADDVNSKILRNWAEFIYNYVPSGCWGSQKRVRAWLKASAESAMRIANTPTNEKFKYPTSSHLEDLK